MDSKMKIYDVTRALAPGMYVYPGDPEFVRTAQKSGESTISALSLGTHTGTHIDAPAHYFPAGTTIDELPLSSLITIAEVVSFGALFSHTSSAVLFRSGYHDADENYPELSEKEAEYLISSGVKVVGCDTPSIGSGAVHRILLAAGIAIIELLDLAQVPDGMYHMFALPLKIRGADAAPARVVLLEDEE
ncbi:cyclase family protein [Methanorbis furvi]